MSIKTTNIIFTGDDQDLSVSLPEPVPACTEAEWTEMTGMGWPQLAVTDAEEIIDVSSSSEQVSKAERKIMLRSLIITKLQAGSQLRDTSGDISMATILSCDGAARQGEGAQGPSDKGRERPDDAQPRAQPQPRIPTLPLVFPDDEVTVEEPADKDEAKGFVKRKKQGKKGQKVRKKNNNG